GLSPRGALVRPVAWSADGRRVLCGIAPGTGVQAASLLLGRQPGRGTAIYDVAADRLASLTTTASFSGIGWALSPDGGFILAVSAGSPAAFVGVFDVAQNVMLSLPGIAAATLDPNGSKLALSEGGRRIAFIDPAGSTVRVYDRLAQAHV